MTEEPEDRHQNDTERLLKAKGLLVDKLHRQIEYLDRLLDVPPSAARDSTEGIYRDEIARVGDEIAHVERQLYALKYADPDVLPLLPGPLISAAEYDKLPRESQPRPEDAALARAIEKALSDLTANPRAEPPRLTAMQIYDHHVARDERLPDHGLELLARAMRIDPRSVVTAQRRARIAAADEAGLSTKEIATELRIGPRAVRARRNDQTPEDAALFDAVAVGKDLRALRPAVAAALGLLGEDGRWRPQVIRELTSLPERVEPRLTGYTVHQLPIDDDPNTADVEAVWQDRTIPSNGGILEPNLMREAARIEAQRRWDGQPENDAKQVALAVASKCDTKVDHRKVRRWMDRPDWERAVQSHLTWLRRMDEEGFRAATVTEAMRRLKHEKDHKVLAEISNDAEAIARARADATGQPFQVETVQRWMERPTWEPAVAVQMDRLREEKRETELRLLQRGIPTQTNS